MRSTVTFKRINKEAIMNQLVASQMAGLEQVRPIMEQTLRATIGTQYYSLLDLRRLKYPYRIGGQPPMPPGVINMQSGRFFASIKIIGPTRSNSMVLLSVFSTDEERAWQLGKTEHSIERPYKLLLQARLRRAAAKQLDDLTRSVVRYKVAA